MALIKCPECGKDFSDKAPACPNCGCPIENATFQDSSGIIQNTTTEVESSTPYQTTQYDNKNVTSFRNSKPKKRGKLKGCLPVIIIIFALAAIGGLFSNDKDDTTATDTTVTSTDQPTGEPIETETPTPTKAPTQKEIFVDAISKNKEISEKTAKKIYAILKNDLKFKKIEYNSRVDKKLVLWDLTCDGYKIRIAGDDDSIASITCGTYEMYDGKSVKYTKKDIEARDLNGNEVYYYSIAQDIVKSGLKSPKSADFPSIVWNREDIKMARNGDTVVVQSYVDAQNAFGAELRSEWTVEFIVTDLETYSYAPIYIRIDDTESGEYIDIN